jgi:hypothetical protein
MAQINSEVKAIFLNDIQLPIVDGTFTSNLGGKERTSVMGSGRRLGSTAQNMAGTCGFDIVYTKDLDLTTLDVEDAKLRVVWDRGNEWLMTGADLASPPEVAAPEGRVTLSFEGDPWLLSK